MILYKKNLQHDSKFNVFFRIKLWILQNIWQFSECNYIAFHETSHFFLRCDYIGCINSLKPDDAPMRQCTVASLVKVKACRRLGSKPLPETIIICS